MRALRRAVRAVVLELAHAATARRTDRTFVLVHHRVLTSPPPGDPWSLSVATFEAELDLLARSGFRPLTLAQLESGEIPPGRNVLISFDDGYVSAAEHAVPVLTRRGWHAAFFLVAGAMGASSEWERPFGLEPSRVMSWDDARALAAMGMGVGSHSVTHRDLSTVDEDALRDEIVRSKSIIEERLGRLVGSFAVPFGRDDGRIDRRLVEAGYLCKVTNPLAAARAATIRAYPVVGLLREDPLRLLRMHMSGAYEAVLGLHALLRRRHRS